ncbi:MAG: hypothetical protein R6X20_10050, partial [Phycisphaerae bacterium]
DAAAAGDDKPATFNGVAYRGGAMRLNGFYLPVVVELAGLRAGKGVPILRDHAPNQIVGHADVEVTNNDVRISGVVSGGGQAAREVTTAARRGFPWKLSIGAVGEMERVLAGETVQVNGRTFRGPMYVARKATLREVSFLPIAADRGTSVRVSANAKECDMTFEQWLQANGFDAEQLTDKQRATLEATWKAEIKAAGNNPAEPPPLPARPPAATPPANPPGNPPATPPTGEITAAGAPQVPDVQDLVNRAVSQAVDQVTGRLEARARIDQLTAEHPEIRAQAHRENWDATRTELEVVRTQRTGGPAIHVAEGLSSARVLEAAACMAVSAAREERLVEHYGEQTMEAAHRYRRMGLRDMIRACCQIDGRPGWGIGATEREIAAAGFSTVTLPGILSNIAHKTMWEAYRDVPGVARLLSKKLTASDFKTHTGYVLGSDMKFEEVGPDGELKHGKLTESSYTWRVATYGKFFSLTRQMIRNDDLNAFAEVPRLIGRGAALKIEQLWWTLVLANTGNFFHANNNNYISGAATALDSDALGSAEQKLMKQTDPDGEPTLLMGRYLVVPPELSVTADELYISTSVNTGGSSTKAKVPNRNIWAGKYEPVKSPYPSNSGYTGYSTTAWYLWGDPNDVAPFGLAWLDGVETPTVEDADMPSDVLGRGYRGYIDVGVTQLDPRGAVKAAGA